MSDEKTIENKLAEVRQRRSEQRTNQSQLVVGHEVGNLCDGFERLYIVAGVLFTEYNMAVGFAQGTSIKSGCVVDVNIFELSSIASFSVNLKSIVDIQQIKPTESKPR